MISWSPCLSLRGAHTHRQMTNRKPLKAVTWTLGDKPCRTLVNATGANWTDGKQTCANGKVGKHIG